MYLKTFIINEVAKTAQVNFSMIAAPNTSGGVSNCYFGINHDFKKESKVSGRAIFCNIAHDEYGNIIKYNRLEDICDSYGRIITSRAHVYYTANFEFSNSAAYAFMVTGNPNYTYSNGSIEIQFYTNKGPTTIARSTFNNINSATIGGNVYTDKFTANIPYYEYVLE